MQVLLLTVFVSLMHVVFFLVFFLREGTAGRSISSSERDALLPFHDKEDEERPGQIKKERNREA